MPNPFRLATFAVAVIVAPVLAQTPAGTPVRLHATVIGMTGDMLNIRTDDGVLLPVMVPPGIRIGSVVDRSLADIKPGEFVGSAAMRGRDGRLHAQEVHIFPESQRGSGEGHRPMDLPEQTMTNANVDGIAETAGGRMLKLRYPGGEQEIEVGPEVRVVGMVPGDRSLLQPGVAVTIRAVKAPGGAIAALSIQAEKDGVKPLP